MSHQAVRDFYKALAQSEKVKQQYKKLCNCSFLWISPNKVVSFAQLHGYDFKIDDLRFVRLTNAASATQPAVDFVDYRPTEHPDPAENPAIFRKDHGRDPG